MAAAVSPAVRLLLLPGDGIGPEIAAATEAVLAAAATRHGLDLELARGTIGFAALERHGTTLPSAVVAAALEADGVILGPVSHNAYPPADQGGVNPSGMLRKALDLFANVRPARSIAGVPQPIGSAVDLVVVRENLEGFYADRNMFQGSGEFMPEPGIALAVRKITARGSRRIAERAFAIAAQRPASRVAAVHKANVLRVSDGLFLDEVRAVARQHNDIAYEEVIVDAATALLVRDPGRFDVLVTTNMFGDILSDLATELAGSLGLGASLNVGERHAMAQAQHGSAPDIAGKDVANPVSLIASTAMLLRHLGHGGAADRIDGACDRALADPSTRTRDLGGALGTEAFAAAVVADIRGD
ncbi:MAG: isocitrate/isopropylmalate dehydrogenase family protein [Pseudomonadota bacterium]